MKVLVVDDNKYDRMMLAKMLSINNYEVIEAGNGVEALEKIRTEKPDVIISDILMPAMDGFMLLRELRKSTQTSDIPFVFYSASYSTKKDIQLAEALGVSRFIVKPVEPKELVDQIEEVLRDFSKGELRPAEPRIEGEDVLELYSDRLSRKLDEKISLLEQEIEERKQVELALRESEEQFRATFEQAAIGMARSDIEGRTIQTNRMFQHMLGFSDEELKNMVFTEFTHPEDIELDMELFKGLVAGKCNKYMIKKRFIRKGGAIFWGKMTVSMVRDPQGKPLFSISMVEDITERKEAEDKLKLSEEKYRTLIENIQDGVFIIQDGRLQFVNETFASMVGYDVEEIIGKDFMELIGFEDRERVIDHFKSRKIGKSAKGDFEFSALHRDGSTRIIVTMNDGFIDYMGRPASVGTLKDITESKRAQILLKQSKDFAESVLNSINDSISIITVKDFKIIDVNKAFLEIYGLKKEDVIGKRCYEISHKTKVPCSPETCPLRETLNTGKPSICEHVHKIKNDLHQYAEVSSYPIKDEKGETSRIVHVARDITERKRWEEELKLKAQLLDAASDQIYVHDIYGKFIYINEAAYRTIGYTRDEMMKMNLRDILAPEYRKLMDQQITDLLEKGDAVFESVHSGKGNVPMPVEVHSIVIEYGGENVILSVTRDNTLRKQAEKMLKERARAELYGFIVSALPVFASGVPSHVRDILIRNFSERFEKNVMPRFKDEIRQITGVDDPGQLLDVFMVWLSALYFNFGIENERTTNGRKGVLEFMNCPWVYEARGNPIFCFICRSLAKRSFTWTGLKGNVDQKSSIARGSRTCRFEIHVQREKIEVA